MNAPGTPSGASAYGTTPATTMPSSANSIASPSTTNATRPAPPDFVYQLLYIMPSAKSCDGTGEFAPECATAEQAITPLIDSFAKYDVENYVVQAALLSWIAFESAELKYNQNHFPAPGKPQSGHTLHVQP
jgi:hypothetical protein